MPKNTKRLKLGGRTGEDDRPLWKESRGKTESRECYWPSSQLSLNFGPETRRRFGYRASPLTRLELARRRAPRRLGDGPRARPSEAGERRVATSRHQADPRSDLLVEDGGLKSQRNVLQGGTRLSIRTPKEKKQHGKRRTSLSPSSKKAAQRARGGARDS